MFGIDNIDEPTTTVLKSSGSPSKSPRKANNRRKR
jgi:hypothetical protein